MKSARERDSLNRSIKSILVLGALLLNAAAVSAQQASPPQRLDEHIGACRAPAVVASGAERVVVAWLVAEGSGAGVFMRERRALLFDPPRQLWAGPETRPRDLDVALTADGRAHFVWTALGEKPDCRRLWYAALSADGAQFVARELSELTGCEMDFPTLNPAADNSAHIVWQESAPLGYSLGAGRIAPDGAFEPMPGLGRTDLPSMAPQIINAEPLRVAWQEVGAQSTSLRVDEWSAGEGRWRPAYLETIARRFEPFGGAVLRETHSGLVGSWPGENDAGEPALQSAYYIHTPELSGFVMRNLDRPPGDHARPDMAGFDGPRVTLAWEVLTEGRQAVCLASIFGAANEAAPVVISTPEQRFASWPAHVTRDGFSAVAFIDSFADGGDGGVYFSEVRW
jgi:hypothetical protein